MEIPRWLGCTNETHFFRTYVSFWIFAYSLFHDEIYARLAHQAPGFILSKLSKLRWFFFFFWWCFLVIFLMLNIWHGFKCDLYFYPWLVNCLSTGITPCPTSTPSGRFESFYFPSHLHSFKIELKFVWDERNQNNVEEKKKSDLANTEWKHKMTVCKWVFSGTTTTTASPTTTTTLSTTTTTIRTKSTAPFVPSTAPPEGIAWRME